LKATGWLNHLAIKPPAAQGLGFMASLAASPLPAETVRLKEREALGGRCHT
jgi:hypothetical protein